MFASIRNLKWLPTRDKFNIFKNYSYMKPMKHWKANLNGPLKLYFCVNRKSEMAIVTGHSFNIGNEKNIFTRKLEIWLYPNCTWIINGWSITNIQFVCVEQKSMLADIAGQNSYRILWGKYLKIIFILNQANLDVMFRGLSFTKLVLIVNPRLLPL